MKDRRSRLGFRNKPEKTLKQVQGDRVTRGKDKSVVETVGSQQSAVGSQQYSGKDRTRNTEQGTDIRHQTSDIRQTIRVTYPAGLVAATEILLRSLRGSSAASA